MSTYPAYCPISMKISRRPYLFATFFTYFLLTASGSTQGADWISLNSAAFNQNTCNYLSSPLIVINISSFERAWESAGDCRFRISNRTIFEVDKITTLPRDENVSRDVRTSSILLKVLYGLLVLYLEGMTNSELLGVDNSAHRSLTSDFRVNVLLLPHYKTVWLFTTTCR
jgi:hypothetical protein